jgi:murein DD-endopeptidase MepM/ murein hydrolase activator NlpD
MRPLFLISFGCFLKRIGRRIWLLICIAIPVLAQAADEGEVMASPPIPYKTYTFTPGKLTGQELFLEKENLHCKIFCFDQFHAFPKPTPTVDLRISLRGGYRAHDIFGHDDFVPKEAQDVATGWVPQANGNFIIFPDESKQHLPMWVPERTRLIRVPFVKRYGDTVVNAYDIALALDRFNRGDDKSVSIEFKIVEAADDSGKKGKRLVPANPLTDGVYYAYSLPDDKDTANYGFLFAVGMPSAGTASSTATQGQTTAAPAGIQTGGSQVSSEQTSSFLKFPIKGEFDPWDAKISALMDHDPQKDKLKTFQGEGDNVKHIGSDKEGDDYFEKNDGEEFNLGELSNYQNSKKRFYYDNHRGCDYSYGANHEVIAAADGVLDILYMKKTGLTGLADYHGIAIKHDNGYNTIYLHLSKWSPKIEEIFNDPSKQKNRVQKGDVIGNPGGFGPNGPNTFATHLHFGVHNAKGEIVDPYGEFTKSGLQVAPVLWEELPPSQRLK